MQLTNRLADSLAAKEKPYEVRDDKIKGFLLRVQPSGSKVYYLSYRNAEGKKQRYRIGAHGTITAMQARDAAEKKAGEVALDVDVHKARKSARKQAAIEKAKTLSAFLESHYKPWVLANRKSGAMTLRTIHAQFDHLMDTPLDEITAWSMEQWRSKRKKSGTKPATINRNIVALKALLSKAIEWGVIDNHPLASLKPLPVDTLAKVRFLSVDEEKRLREVLQQREERVRQARQSHNAWLKERRYEPVAAISAKQFADHLQPMVLLSINTGLRRGELFALKWEDISLSKAQLTVVGETSKSGKTRHVALNTEAMKWRPKIDVHGLVFPSKNEGNQFNNVRKAFLGVLIEAEIKSFRWHDMRHHFASKLVMKGVDLNTVRELLGHASMDMTLRYAHLAPEHKAEAVARLNDG